MIELVSKDTTYKVKNKPNEINLETFQKIVKETDETKTFFFEYWLNVIRILSDKEGVEKIISEEDFYKVIEKLNFYDIEVKDEIVIDDVKYTANVENKKPKLTAWEFSELEKLTKKYPDEWMSKCMSLIFKTDVENKDVFKEKDKLFKEKMTIDIALPFLLYINQSLINNIKKLSEVNGEK